MTFKIINNLSDQKNHSVRLKELFEISESVLVVSPYLMSDAGDFLSGINLTKIKASIILTIQLQILSSFQIKFQTFLILLDITNEK